MPVTARLSKRFYEVLGEDVANELVTWFNDVDATYRADLRALNEATSFRTPRGRVRTSVRHNQRRQPATRHNQRRQPATAPNRRATLTGIVEPPLQDGAPLPFPLARSNPTLGR